jgi:hypothetical protein
MSQNPNYALEPTYQELNLLAQGNNGSHPPRSIQIGTITEPLPTYQEAVR